MRARCSATGSIGSAGLPGKLLHNIISHGVARIAEFLSGDRPRVIAHGFVSPRLEAMGEREIVDELRVIIQDEESTTASFTVLLTAAPDAASVSDLRPQRRPASSIRIRRR